MTTPNTTARQAGLTEALHYLQMGIANLELGNGVHMVDFRNAERAILAAHSADARNGEGVTLTPEDMEPMLVAANIPVEVWEEVMDFAAMLLAAPAAPAPKDAEILQIIDERDAYHEIADDLAAQIAAITDVEIGEHSSVNDPWRNAMLAADDFIAKQLRKLLAGPSAPAPAAQADEHSGKGIAIWLEDLRRAHTYLDEGKPFFTGKDCAELADLLEELAQQSATPAEPVYQEESPNGLWYDIPKAMYEDLARKAYRGGRTRVLYTTPADAASEADKSHD